ncbi:MAG: hypothetical protein HYY05_08390, partial [Chloroflexi bacterium]|nr:hypothetical protein [Chloroflexota bacterium]
MIETAPWFAVDTALGWMGVAYGARGLQRLALPRADSATLTQELGPARGPVPPAWTDLARRLEDYA